MIKNEDKYSNRLYLKISLTTFIISLLILILVSFILGVFCITPFGKHFFKGFASTTVIIVMTIYLSSAFLSSFLSFFVAKKVFKPLVELSSKSMKVAAGNFNVSVDENSSIPELRDTLHNFNIMVHELAKVETLSNDFVSNVSHEFKTPLSVIRSYVNILQSGNLSEDERAGYLNQINISIEKLSTLVSNVLKICKLDNQNVVMTRKPFRLDEQLRTSILLFSDDIEDKCLNLELDLDDCVLNNDEDLLSQVWVNLISNAIKFTPKNGTISLSLKIDDFIEVRIKDTGEGMDELTLKHIFDRFYQGETSHSKDGNGLGLTIVSKILKLCRASINVESKLHDGSAFIIRFSKNN